MHLVLKVAQPGLRQSGCYLSQAFAPSILSATFASRTPLAPRFVPSRGLSTSPGSSVKTLRRPTRLSVTTSREPPPPPPPTSPPSSFFTPSICRFPIRQLSTTSRCQRQTTQTSDTTPITSAGAINPPATSVVLDWNDFFRLRTSRRRFSLTSSVLSATVVTLATSVALANYPELADQISKIVPVDPMVGLGLTVFAATLLGWLLGPIVGNALWRLLYRSRMPEFTIKERAFFERIKSHRVNPAGGSTNNPVPDYYGEKIGSVGGYRRWLKDQRAFNRKKGGVFV